MSTVNFICSLKPSDDCSNVPNADLQHCDESADVPHTIAKELAWHHVSVYVRREHDQHIGVYCFSRSGI